MAPRKKSRHRVPVEIVMRITDEITPEYQREIDRSMSKLETEYAQAQKRLDDAERRALKVGPKPDKHRRRSEAKTNEKRLIDLWAEVELRRQELMDIERLMRGGTPQRNRGRGSFKPVGIYPNRSLI